MGIGHDHRLEGAGEQWDALVADVEAIAEEYDEAGWHALALHPGDVTLDDGGFDVLVPDDEFERVRTAVAECAFEDGETYRRAEAGVVFALAAFEAEPDRTAVLVPLYYGVAEAARLAELDRLRVRVRRLDETDVAFTHRRPELFVPGRGD